MSKGKKSSSFSRFSSSSWTKTISSSSTLFLPLFLLVLPLSRAELLQFNETTGLPTCAYSCKPLYSAQYACSSAAAAAAASISVETACFCNSIYIKSQPKGWACNEFCDSKGRERVKKWVAVTCSTYTGDHAVQGNGTDATGGVSSSTRKNQTDVGNDESGGENEDTTVKKNWWKKNFLWFLLAFLLVIIPILVCAFIAPIRRFINRQTTNLRNSTLKKPSTPPTIAPYWSPGLQPPLADVPFSPGLSTVAVPTTPTVTITPTAPRSEEGGVMITRPYTDSLVQYGDEHEYSDIHTPVTGQSSINIQSPQPAAAAPQPPAAAAVFTDIPLPSSPPGLPPRMVSVDQSVFVVGGGAVGGAALQEMQRVRQESWERNMMREQEKAAKRGFGERLAFWRRWSKAGGKTAAAATRRGGEGRRPVGV